MAKGFLKNAITPAVRTAQQHYYDRGYPDFDGEPSLDPLTAEEIEFIESRDSFYLSTILESDWPYIQHRGGTKGFLRSTGGNQLAFADHGGNRQMVSTGSISANDKISLFLMDYPTKERLKILGHCKVLDAREHPKLVEEITPPDGHAAKVERIFVIEVESFDWNCPKFITPRYTEEQIADRVAPLHERIAELEKQIASS